MTRFIRGAERSQSTLLPECLDDWVDDDNPVRAIDVFVDGLDLAELGFEGVTPAATGRPAYHPAILLKLYIYGYLNRVQSSRRLEREAARNLEVIWLLGRLVPDDKVIADFRKDNGPAIKKVCARFVELCREMGLLAKASVAIDGSKFKAVNNRDRNFTKGKVERRRQQLEESVARYLSQLDTADHQIPTVALAIKTEHLKQKLAKIKDELKKLAAHEKRMLASPDEQISLTDPDSRSMATSGRGSGVVGYNVQVAVDTENHLIVTHEVTNSGSDRAQLANVGKQAKAVLGVEKLEAVADRGYYNSPEILACERAGITVDAAEADDVGRKIRGAARKAGLSLHRVSGRLSLPGRRISGVSIYPRRRWKAASPLLDECLRRMSLEEEMHDGQGAAHLPLGARGRARSGAGAARRRPHGHAPPPRDRRASVRHHEGADGRDALSVQDATQGGDRDGALGARLQSDARHEHRGGEAADGGDAGGMRGDLSFVPRPAVLARIAPRSVRGRTGRRSGKNCSKRTLAATLPVSRPVRTPYAALSRNQDPMLTSEHIMTPWRSMSAAHSTLKQRGTTRRAIAFD